MSESYQYNPEHETAQPARTQEQSIDAVEAREAKERAEQLRDIGRYTVMSIATRQEVLTLSLNQEHLRQAA